MFKLHFKKNNQNDKIIQLISICLYNKNMSPSMKVHVHWVNLMKNQIIQKFQSFEIKKKRLQGKTLIFLMI